MLLLIVAHCHNKCVKRGTKRFVFKKVVDLDIGNIGIAFKSNDLLMYLMKDYVWKY